MIDSSHCFMFVLSVCHLRKYVQHIQAWTKWLLFCRRYFQYIFLNETIFFVGFNFFKSLLPRVQLVSIVSGNGLTPNKRQAIIWTNDAVVHWRIHVLPCLYVRNSEFTCTEGLTVGGIVSLYVSADVSMFIMSITVTSNERHGVPNHHQLHCLLDSLFKLTKGFSFDKLRETNSHYVILCDDGQFS